MAGIWQETTSENEHDTDREPELETEQETKGSAGQRSVPDGTGP